MGSTFASLVYDDPNEWYALDYSDAHGNPLIMLGIDIDAFNRFNEGLPATIASGLHADLTTLGVDTTLVWTPTKWGFGSAMKQYLRRGGPDVTNLAWYSIDIPQIESETGEVCSDCKGTCERDGNRCPYCDGHGTLTKLDWRKATWTAASLTLLAQLLWEPRREWLQGVPQTSPKQLMTVDVGFTGGGYLRAMLGHEIGNYLNAAPQDSEISVARAAIRTSYLRMFKRYERFGDSVFGARVQDGQQFLLHTAGNASMYLDRSRHTARNTLSPLAMFDDNIDSHAQLISLFCGLAALHGAVRRKLYPHL